MTDGIKHKMSVSQKKRHDSIWKDGEKQCPRCKTFKSLSQFYKSNCPSHSRGIYTYCIECTKKKNLGRKRTRSYSILEAYGDYRRNAKVKKIEFNLSINDLGTLIHADCYYCKKFPREINGIDRVDSSKGYTLDNCVPCCWRCNYLKNKTSQKDFATWILDIYPWAKEYMMEEKS